LYILNLSHITLSTSGKISKAEEFLAICINKTTLESFLPNPNKKVKLKNNKKYKYNIFVD